MLRNLLGLGMLLNTESYQKGQAAARDGRPLGDNPYRLASAHRDDWELGWRVATRMADLATIRDAAATIPASSPYDAGHAAAARGVGAAANPYIVGSPAHDAWRRGWADRKAM